MSTPDPCEPLPRTLECRDLPGAPALRAPPRRPYLFFFERREAAIGGDGVRRIQLRVPTVPRGRDECDPEDLDLAHWVCRQLPQISPGWDAEWRFDSDAEAAALIERLLPHASRRSRGDRASFEAARSDRSPAAAQALLEELDALLARRPGDAVSHFERAPLVRDMGRTEEALASYELAATDPSLAAEALAGAAELAAARGLDPGMVHRYIDRVLPAGGWPATSMRRLRASLLLREGRREEAVPALREAGQPLQAARLLRELGRLEDAVGAYAEVLSGDERASAYILALDEQAQTLAELGRTDEALEHAGRLLALSPLWFSALLLRGRLHARLGRRAQALPDLVLCARYSPPHREAAAAVLRELGEAVPELEAGDAGPARSLRP